MDTTSISQSTSPATKVPRVLALAKTPRLDSLLHQVQRAKDEAGQPVPLLDELFFLLDDPPPGTGDRWEKGAELCQRHGIATSRTAVWRMYRAHVLQWRREQFAAAQPDTPPDPAETARLQEQACHLAAQRVIEFLHDPRLSPGHLIGLIQNDHLRRQIQLARDQFNDRINERLSESNRLLHKASRGAIEDEIRLKLLHKARMKSFRQIIKSRPPVTPHSTS